MNRLIAFAFMTLTASPAYAQSETIEFRAECRKANDRGCSADNTGVYQAPDGKYIEPDSVTAGQVMNYWKVQPRCQSPALAGRVPYTIPGTTAVASFFTSFQAPLHVESGSGLDDIGKVAFVTCRYSFRLGDLPAGASN